eukprot:261260-Chlamydomonas_euryale.AAC.1
MRALGVRVGQCRDGVWVMHAKQYAMMGHASGPCSCHADGSSRAAMQGRHAAAMQSGHAGWPC